jgi:MFS family permease
MPAVTVRTQTSGPLAPLRVPGFKVLLGGYSVNELGNWLGDIALAVLVFDKTGSPLATAALFVGTRFTPAFLSPLVVARIEAFRPRVALASLYGADAIVFGVLALLAASHFSLALVVVLGAVDGTLALAARAFTRSSSAALLGGRGLLGRGNALFNIGFTAAGALGPAIAGLVVSQAGAQAALWADAASFAGVAILTGTAAALPVGESAEGEWKTRLREGFAYVRSRRLLFGLFVAQGVTSLFFFIVVPIEVVYAKETLHAGSSGYGWLLACWGLGMIGGGILVARAHYVRVQTLLFAGTVAISLSYLGMAVAPGLAVACAIAVVGGAGNGLQWVSMINAVQQLTSSAMQTRVMGLLEGVAAAVPAVGFAVGGALTAAASPRIAYAIAGAGGVLVVIVAVWRLAAAPWVGAGAASSDDAVAPAGHGPKPS